MLEMSAAPVQPEPAQTTDSDWMKRWEEIERNVHNPRFTISRVKPDGSVKYVGDSDASSSSSGSTTSQCSAHKLMESKSSEIQQFKRSHKSKSSILRTADSLDLLPISARANRVPMSERGRVCEF